MLARVIPRPRLLTCTDCGFLRVPLLVFHLFTRPGVAVVNTDGSSDGSELFMLVCGVWISCALLLWQRRSNWLGWMARTTR